jgi:hypothetical protein
MTKLEYSEIGKTRNKGKFRPGISGNPSGRPKKNYRVTELARRCSIDAINELFKIAMNPKTKDADKVKAIGIILDRAFGKIN